MAVSNVPEVCRIFTHLKSGTLAHSVLAQLEVCQEKCELNQYLNGRKWRATPDSDDHYVFAIAL
jgi:hypothetical protein